MKIDTVCLSETGQKTVTHSIITGEAATPLLAELDRAPYLARFLFGKELSIRINDRQFIRRMPDRPAVFKSTQESKQ